VMMRSVFLWLSSYPSSSSRFIVGLSAWNVKVFTFQLSFLFFGIVPFYLGILVRYLSYLGLVFFWQLKYAVFFFPFSSDFIQGFTSAVSAFCSSQKGPYRQEILTAYGCLRRALLWQRIFLVLKFFSNSVKRENLRIRLVLLLVITWNKADKGLPIFLGSLLGSSTSWIRPSEVQPGFYPWLARRLPLYLPYEERFSLKLASDSLYPFFSPLSYDIAATAVLVYSSFTDVSTCDRLRYT
jgi:hypothetical protein